MKLNRKRKGRWITITATVVAIMGINATNVAAESSEEVVENTVVMLTMDSDTNLVEDTTFVLGSTDELLQEDLEVTSEVTSEELEIKDTSSINVQENIETSQV